MKTLKLYETIPINDLDVKGIIHSLYSKGALDYLTLDEVKDLNNEYYLNHSTYKYVTSMYYRLSLEYGNDIALDKLASIIKTKYRIKWSKIYDVIFNGSYNPLYNYDMEETYTPKVKTTAVTKNKTKLENAVETSLDVSGFNSEDYVPSNKTDSKTVTSGNEDDNKTTTEQSTDGFNVTTRRGNIGVMTTQDLIERELKLRDYDFFNTIMSDIDKELCLQVY